MYDDYDSYAADGYQNEEDGWSPGEYFSPEGIKGRWAGEQPDGRAGGRGRQDSGSAADRDPFDSGHDPFDAAFASPGRGKSDPRGGYGADEYATGAYELPDGADSPERGRRRRKDREDRGERTGILPRLRRDRGEDIWPDDGISDEDYWASVAADRPLNGADSPRDDERGPASGAPRRPAAPQPGEQRSDLRGDQRGGDLRGVTGRLGPPPGLAGDYQPGNMAGSGPMPRAGQPGARTSGGQLAVGQPGGARASNGQPGGPRISGGQPAVGQPGGARASNGQPGGPRISGSQPAVGRPGGARASGGWLAAGQPGGSSRTSSGPMPAYPGTGPMPARPGTGPTPVRSATGPTPARSANGAAPLRSTSGPIPARPATGPTPTVGVTASRPPAGQHGMRPGPGTGPSPAWPGQAPQRPGSGSGGFPQASPRPSFQPNGFQPGGGAGRPQDRGDYGDRTERIERVTASGYPDQRPGGRGPTGPVPGGPSGAPGRGRDDSGAWRTLDRREADRRDADRRDADRRDADRRDADRRDADRRDADRRDADRRETERRDASRREAERREADRREGGRDSGGWPVPSRGGAPAWGGANDDPLTSQAYSRSALTDTDGRSYRVAARRSQAQAMLTEQVESFITGQYQSGQSGHTGDYPTAAFRPAEQRTGEYRQYRGDAPAATGQTVTGQYPAYGSQDGRQTAAHPTQQARAIGPAGAGSAPATSGWPAQPGMPGGQYEGQRQPQQQRPQAQQPGQAAPLPAMPLSAPVPSASGPATGSSPVAQPGGGVPAKGGLNPYDVAITGSYPYPGQALPGASQSGASQSGASQSGTSQYGLPQSGVDDPYYRPLPADGYPSGSGDPGRSDPARAGYGAGYANGYPDPRDRHNY